MASDWSPNQPHFWDRRKRQVVCARTLAPIANGFNGRFVRKGSLYRAPNSGGPRRTAGGAGEDGCQRSWGWTCVLAEL